VNHQFDHLFYCTRCGVSAERVERGDVESVCLFTNRYSDRDREHPNELVQRLIRLRGLRG
jgi:hypothetical protein